MLVLSAIIIGGAAGVYFFSGQTEPAAIVQEPVNPVEEKSEVNPTPEIEEAPEVEEAVESEIPQTPEIPQEYPLQEELADEPVEEIQEDGTATATEGAIYSSKNAELIRLLGNLTVKTGNNANII